MNNVATTYDCVLDASARGRLGKLAIMVMLTAVHILHNAPVELVVQKYQMASLVQPMIIVKVGGVTPRSPLVAVDLVNEKLMTTKVRNFPEVQ